MGMAVDIVVRYGMQLADALVARARARHRASRPEGRQRDRDAFGQTEGAGFRVVAAVDPRKTSARRRRSSIHRGTTNIRSSARSRTWRRNCCVGQDASTNSDIWAVGVLLYEMAAGHRPFKGASAFELSAMILREAPPAIDPPLPPVLQSVIDKCLDKDPGQRYHSGGEVRAALEAAATASRSERIPVAALAVHETAQRSERLQKRLWWSAAAFVAVIAVLGFLLWKANHPHVAPGPKPLPGAIQSVAVLPLENLSGDPAQDYFSDGMTDALITELSHIRKLRVISRTSVMQYKRTQKPLADIARDLNVDAVVEGTVVRASGRVKISAKLIQTSMEETLWADSYERDFTDVLALQSDVATAVAHGIQVELSAPEASLLASRRPVVPEAYEAFLRGRFEAEKRNPQGLVNSVEYFQQAIAKDSTYAAAYAGLADSFLNLSTYEIRSPAEVDAAGKSGGGASVEHRSESGRSSRVTCRHPLLSSGNRGRRE